LNFYFLYFSDTMLTFLKGRIFDAVCLQIGRRGNGGMIYNLYS